MARGGRRRVLDEEPKAERRLTPAHDRQDPVSGAAGQVLRLQMLAGNTAVNAMMRSAAIQRDEGGGAAPADTKEKPKSSGPHVTVEGIGEFSALSFQVTSSPKDVGDADAPKEPTEVLVTKELDQLSSDLQRAAAKGESIPSVTIVIGGGRVRLVLKNVYISSYQISGTGEGMESLTFSGAEAEWKHSGGGEGGY